MIFKARIWPIVTGGFIAWKIKDSPESTETPQNIPEDYDLIGAKDAAQKIG